MLMPGRAGSAQQLFLAVVGARTAGHALPNWTRGHRAGFALGGGCELALACDMRVAADTATFGQPEVQLGIIPGAGGTQRLTRLVGPARAKDIVLSGRRVKAREALAIGLADRVFPAAVLQQEARAMALSFAAGATAAQALAKRAIDGAFDLPLAEGVGMEQELFVQVFDTEDARTGVQSFIEHGPGKATFKGKGEAEGQTTVSARYSLARYNLQDRDAALRGVDEHIVKHLRDLANVLTRKG